jgi:hypothetical protein
MNGKGGIAMLECVCQNKHVVDADGEDEEGDDLDGGGVGEARAFVASNQTSEMMRVAETRAAVAMPTAMPIERTTVTTALRPSKKRDSTNVRLLSGKM